MSLLGPRDSSAHSSSHRPNYLRWVILAVVALALGGGSWYYFLGRKPRIVLSVPLKQDQDGFGEVQGWMLPNGELLSLSGDELKLCDLDGRKEKWAVKVPKLAPADPAWQAGLNARFLRLQQWAATLAQKRAALTTPQATKAFNDEVAKYQAELVAARAEAAKIPPPPRTPIPRADQDDDGDGEMLITPPTGGRVEEAHVAAARAVVSRAAAQTDEAQGLTIAPSRVAASQPVATGGGVSAETKMLQDRVTKRTKALAEMDQKIKTKSQAAKTDLARAEVKDLEAKRAMLAAEQSADQAAITKATAGPASVAPSVPTGVLAGAGAAAGLLDDGEELEAAYFTECPTQAFLVGERIWLVGDGHAVAFAPADGAVKADVRLSGAVIRVFSNGTMLFIVAEAGAQARQLTRIDAAGTSTSLYMATPAREVAFTSSREDGVKANIQAHRVEFSAGGGALARADIQLVQRQMKTRELIKPGAEQDLEKTVAKSRGNSTEEIMAIADLIAVDGQRSAGPSTEQVDDSIYEVTLTRPFEAAVAWRDRMQGRVQVISTPSLDLVTAGKRLIALDRTNKKLWETTLGAPVTQRSEETDWEEDPAALLELDGKLYFADGAFLTALEMTTGKVLWRLPSVGIRKVDADADGNLYVMTDNLSVDSLYYAVTGQSEVPTASVLKVDRETGKILWDAPKYENLWVSGKDVYAFRQFFHAEDATNRVFDASKVPEARVKVYKLSRGDGKPVWDWFQTRRPSQVFARGKTVALLFRTELQVLHSIAF